MKTLPVLAACVLVAVAGGCGDDSDTTTATDSGPLVSYARAGGVAAMPESLVVEADGSATVEAGVDPARESFELEADELERLRAELEAADFDRVPTEPSGCNDCYEYEIVFDGETTSYDQSQSVPDSVAVVVAHLSEITADNYPAGATEPPIVN